jgi:streptomycin 6-kinase
VNNMLEASVLNRFRIVSHVLYDDRPSATVWKVVVQDGSNAALKVYKQPGRGNEATGVRYLARMGPLAVGIRDQAGAAVLMDWLEGPTLGDVARAGEADRADAILAEVVHNLLGTEICASGLTPLHHFLSPLADIASGDSTLNYLAELAAQLQNDPDTEIALHGDLHHDNICLHNGEWVVFDAKGIAGVRAYELANAFRHPRGIPDYVSAPDVIARRLDIWGRALVVAPEKIAKWAAVKIGLSAVWAGKMPEQDRRILDILLAAY